MLPALLLLTLFPSELPFNRFTFSEPHMGTQCKIIVYAADEAVARKAVKDAFARIAFLDAIMSDYRPASELMRLCAKAGGPPVEVGPDLFFVLSKAQEVSRLSDGAFDVSVGPVVRLWRRCRRTQRLPEPDQLAKARALVDYRQIRLDPAKRTVQLLKPGMQLDLGGIAKGYAADEALKILKGHRIDRALVAIGGDIAVSGPPPDRENGWSIDIASVDDIERNLPRTLLLKDAAVSTSGDAEQHVVIDGKRYSHIVDPRTGVGLTDPITVTVVARRGIDADSLTKIICVLGPERGFRLLEKYSDGGTGASPVQADKNRGDAGSTFKLARMPAARAVRRTAMGSKIYVSKGFPPLVRQASRKPPPAELSPKRR